MNLRAKENVIRVLIVRGAVVPVVLTACALSIAPTGWGHSSARTGLPVCTHKQGASLGAAYEKWAKTHSAATQRATTVELTKLSKQFHCEPRG